MRLLLLLALTSVAAADPQAWPATGTQIDLTWVVYPDLAKATRTAHVELEAKIGTVTQTIQIGDTYGALSPLDQPLCNGAPRGAGAPPKLYLSAKEVAKLVFGGGVVRGYTVRREKAGDLRIVEFDRGDDSCGKPSCPPKPLSSVAIPARIMTFREHLVLVDKAGKRAPISCKVD